MRGLDRAGDRRERGAERPVVLDVRAGDERVGDRGEQLERLRAGHPALRAVVDARHAASWIRTVADFGPSPCMTGTAELPGYFASYAASMASELSLPADSNVTS